MSSDARRLRVLVLDHTAELGGAELALVRLLDAIGDRADVTTALLSDGPLADRLRDGGHPVEIIPMSVEVTNIRRHDLIRMVLSPLRLVPLVWRLARLARELDADLIHTTSLKADVIGLAVGVVARRPLVWHLHDRVAPDYLPRPLVTVLRVAARRVTRVIVNSAATAATVPGRADLVIASPGLAPDQIRDSPRPLPDSSPRIGLVGRISPTKDQLTFVRAAALVQQAHPAARFIIVGRAAFGAEDYEQAVRAEVVRLGLADAVTFAGFTDDIPAVLDGLTVCVHTASIPEPFGQSVIEAMGRGVPVVATSGGGVDEIFADATGSVLGWLVPSGAPLTLAAAITAALSDPDEAERRGRHAWESVRARYPIARTADVVLDVWQRIGPR